MVSMAEFKHNRKFHLLVDSLIGALVCGLTALLASTVSAGHSWQATVPLVFSCVLLFVSARFGTRAGISGTVLAAVIFALFLFRPHGSIQIADESARGNLAWMLLLGFSFSFLFVPSTTRLRR
jgi:integral membrane sensor domain MASE1